MATEMMKPNANNGPVGGNGHEPRYDFSKIRTSVRIPNLIEIQRESYNRFLQMDLLPEERENTGLQAVFSQSFRSPIFAAPRRSISSSIRSVTGSVSAAS